MALAHHSRFNWLVLLVAISIGAIVAASLAPHGETNQFVMDGGNSGQGLPDAVGAGSELGIAASAGLLGHAHAEPSLPVTGSLIEVASIRDGADGFTELDSPRSVATFQIGSNAYAAIASEADGVQMVDVTDPANPATTAYISDSDARELDGARDIEIFEINGRTYAIVTGFSDNGVQIIDVTDPHQPVAAGRIDNSRLTDFSSPSDVAVFETGGGLYAIVTTLGRTAVQIIDITDPFNPAPAGYMRDSRHLELKGAFGVDTFEIDGGTYAIVVGHRDNGVQIINVTDPHAPVAAGSVADSPSLELNHAVGVATFESGGSTYAVVAGYEDYGIQVINVTDPLNPAPAGRITSRAGGGEYSRVIQVALFEVGGGTYAVTSFYQFGNMHLVDLTDPYNPADLAHIRPSRYSTGYGIDVFETGGSLYAISTTLASGSAYILRINMSIDRPPQLLVNLQPFVSIPAGTTYEDTGAICIDEVDGDLTDQIRTVSNVSSTVAGMYTVTYTCADSVGNAVTAVREVEVENTKPPVLLSTAYMAGNGTMRIIFSEPLNPAVHWDRLHIRDTGASSGGVALDGVTGSVYGAILTVTLHASQMATVDNMAIPQLDIDQDAVVDPFGNGIAAAPDQTITIFRNNAPTVVSITRSDPTAEVTNRTSLVFQVAFSENVTGVDAGDFALSPDSTGAGGASGQFTQTSEPALRIADRSTIQDAITVDRSGTATSVSVAVDITHTYRGDLVIDLIAPDGTAQTLHDRSGGNADGIGRTYTPDFDGTGIAGDWILRVSDRGWGDTGTLNGWTLTIGHDGAVGSVTGLAGSGSRYLVTVSAAQDGTYNLDLVSSGHGIADAADNPLSSPTPTGADHTYTVSATASDTVAVTITDTPEDPPITPAQNIIEVLEAPTPRDPRDIGRITLTSAASGTILATWEAPTEDPANYRISWAKVGGPFRTWTDLTGNAFPTEPTHTITDLEEGVEYKVMVLASYAGTAGDWSGELTITTAGSSNNPAAAPDAPQNLRAVPTHNSVILTWSQPDDDSITGYNVLSPSPTNQSRLSVLVAQTNSAEASYTVTDLRPSTTYVLGLVAINEHGESDPSEPVSTSTAVSAHTHFVTTWKTTETNESITIPVGEATGRYTVDWGDGTVSTNVRGNQLHAYDTPGTYTVRIYGDFTRIHLNEQQPNANKMRSIEQWGDIRWESMESAFMGAKNMVSRTTDAPDLSGVTDMSRMFFQASSFNQDLSTWDVSSVTNMLQMFVGATSFNGSVSSWNVSQVADMADMFDGASSFEQNLGPWYIVPADTAFSASDDSLNVTTISAQNAFLDGQGPRYDIGTGGDSDLFNVTDGSTLMFKVAPTAGDHTVNVTSTGDLGTGNHLMLTVTGTANRPPSVQAGPDLSVPEGSQRALAGSATDPDGGGLAYSWSQSPASPAISFDDRTSPTATITAPQVSSTTEFTLTLTADDGEATGSDTMVLTAVHANRPPSVQAGPDLSVPEGSQRALAGSATDPDGGGLAYSWSQSPASPAISFDDRTSPTATITAPQVSSTTEFTLTLTADDGEATGSDTMVLTAVHANRPPSVQAGPDLSVPEGSQRALAGSATDPDGGGLAYSWSQSPASPAISFDDRTSPTATITAPQVSSTTEFTLTLTADDGEATGSDTMVLTAVHANRPPSVQAGPDLSVPEGSQRALAGSATDPDGGGLAYSWSQSPASPAISFDDRTSPTATITAPQVSSTTEFTLTLTADDGEATGSDTMVLTAVHANRPPSVQAGPDQTVAEGSTVHLNATASDDDSSDTLTYSWSHDSTLDIAFDNPTAPSTTLIAPQTPSNTTVTLTLTADDGTDTSSDTLALTITDTFSVSNTLQPSSFVTTLQTTTGNESITIPVGGATGVYTINWGDGTVSADVTGDQTHTYDVAGTYVVSIYGDFTRINLNGDPNASKLLSIDQWGSMQWESMEFAFKGASSMVYRATDAPNLSDVTSMRYMFRDATSFNGDLSSWDVSSVTNMIGVFEGATSFNADLSRWDVSNANDMRYMFRDATSFNGDLSSWDTSSVISMTSMFNGATSFNGDLSRWDVSNANDMRYMFRDATSFNGDLSRWNVSGVTTMVDMFYGATSFNTDLSRWDASSVTNMGGMFRDASSFNQDISRWDVSQVTDMNRMFDGASSFEQNLGAWYITLDSDTIDDGDASRTVGNLAAQNAFLARQVTSYGIGTSGDSASFVMDGSTLKLMVAPNHTAQSTYAVNVTASGDLSGAGSWRSFEIAVTPVSEHAQANSPPTAGAGPDRIAAEGDPVTLTGTASDPDDVPLTYRWSHDSSLPVTLDNATSLSPTFTAPAVDADTIVTFTLTVTDDRGASSSTTVSITILDVPPTPPSSPPAAPQNLRATSTNTTITLTWDDPADATVTGYKIISRTPQTEDRLSVLVAATGSADTTYTVTGLAPDTIYVFRVIALSEHDESDRSDFVRLSTLP